MGQQFAGGKVLDLFCGTGAMGMEALSQGAREVCFVDKNRHLCLNLKRTLASYHVADRARVICADACTTVRKFASEGIRFDLVFADPPYEKGMGLRLLEVMKDNVILGTNGWLIIETYKIDELPCEEGYLGLKRKDLYGDTAISYYSHRRRKDI